MLSAQRLWGSLSFSFLECMCGGLAKGRGAAFGDSLDSRCAPSAFIVVIEPLDDVLDVVCPKSRGSDVVGLSVVEFRPVRVGDFIEEQRAVLTGFCDWLAHFLLPPFEVY